jgi:RNA recognition motif-containing protein
MIIIILNLPRETTATELTELFKAYGAVESCDLVKDIKTGKSKGFGFIEMANEDEANEAIKNLHDKKVGSSKIRVKASNKNK